MGRRGAALQDNVTVRRVVGYDGHAVFRHDGGNGRASPAGLETRRIFIIFLESNEAPERRAGCSAWAKGRRDDSCPHRSICVLVMGEAARLGCRRPHVRWRRQSCRCAASARPPGEFMGEGLELRNGVYHCSRYGIASLLAVFRQDMLGYLRYDGQNRRLSKYMTTWVRRQFVQSSKTGRPPGQAGDTPRAAIELRHQLQIRRWVTNSLRL